MIKLLQIVALFVIAGYLNAQSILYVNASATGANNGSSWSNAYTHLQNAIDAAPNGSEIWVKQGIYIPGAGISGTDYNAHYSIQNKNLSLFGGFSGTETAKSQRLSANYTSLSGKFDFPSCLDCEISTVLKIKNSNQVVLDGFKGQDANELISIDTSNVKFFNCLLDTNFTTSRINLRNQSSIEFNQCKFEKFNNAGLLIDGQNNITFRNCQMSGINSSFLSQLTFGIQDTKLIMKSCQFDKMTGAIVVGDTINLELDSCLIQNSSTSTILCNSLKLTNCLIDSCSEFALISKNNSDSSLIISNTFFSRILNNNSTKLISSNGGTHIQNCEFKNLTIEQYIINKQNTLTEFNIRNSTFENCSISYFAAVYASTISIKNILFNNFKHRYPNTSYPSSIFICDSSIVDSLSFKHSQLHFDNESFQFNYSNIKVDSCESFSIRLQGTNFSTADFNQIENIELTNIKKINRPLLLITGPNNITMDSVFLKNIKETSNSVIYCLANNYNLNHVTIENSDAGILFAGSKHGIINNSMFKNINEVRQITPSNLLNTDSLIVSNCTFENNYTYEDGGAIKVASSNGKSNFISQNNIFKNNQAAYNGGGVFCVQNFTSIGDLYYNNKATLGSSIYMLDSATIINSSFILNHDKTIFSDADTINKVVLYNCLFHKNKSIGVGIDSAYHCILPYTLPGENNILGDPKINLKFQLLPMSPAINAGMDVSSLVDSIPLRDVFGNLRIQHGAIDIGALEADSLIQYNVIQGMVTRDFGQNCTIETPAEKGIPGIMVAIQPGNIFTSTDTSGHFEAPAEIGNYVVNQLLTEKEQSYITPLCPTPSEFAVSFTQMPDTSNFLDFYNEITTCSNLTVNVGNNRMVRCFKGYAFIQYCNEGNLNATNVKVKVTLPEYVVPLSFSEFNVDTLDSKTFVFNLGTVAANYCGNIVIEDSIACEMEAMDATQCITAEISPKTSCLQESPLWDKSEIQLKPMCAGNTAMFRVLNIGIGDMLDSTAFRIYFDTLLGYQGKLMIKSNDSITIEVATHGQTIFMEVDQRPAYSGDSLVRSFVESCSDTSLLSVNTFRIGLPLSKPPIDITHSNTHCSIISGSFDPNEKNVNPAGIGAENYVYPNDKLEYTIHFQNTGSDTAYNILITDTLSPFLDLTTLEIGSSSHPFHFFLSGKGRPVLNWGFDNIYLPDSNRNEAQSHGFVKFSIQQKNNPLGTVIKNNASIYFDYNDPVITNETSLETWNGIPQDLSLGSRVNVTVTGIRNPLYFVSNVSPNPGTGKFSFSIAQAIQGTNTLSVFDVNGSPVMKSTFEGATSEIDISNLKKGMYFYRIQNDSDGFSTGKLILY